MGFWRRRATSPAKRIPLYRMSEASPRHPCEINDEADRQPDHQHGKAMLGPGTQGRPQDQAGNADDDEEDADGIDDEAPSRAAETACLVLDFGFAAFALNDRFDEMPRRF